MPYPSKRLITPHTARPAPSATTSVCKIEIAELKNAILIYGTGISVFTIFLFPAKATGRKGQIPSFFRDPSSGPLSFLFPCIRFLPCPWQCPYPKSVYSLSLLSTWRIPCTIYAAQGTAMLFPSISYRLVSPICLPSCLYFVQPSGNPCRRSHSSGVRRRTAYGRPLPSAVTGAITTWRSTVVRV